MGEPALIYLVASTIQRLAAFLLIPLYTRRLTLEEYGDFALSQTVTTPVSLLIGSGLSTSVIRFYFDGGSQREVGVRRSASVARWITIIVVLCCVVWATVIWGIGRDGIGPFDRHALLLILLQAAGSSLASPAIAHLRAANRPLAVAAFQLSDFLLTVSLGVMLVAHCERGWHGALEASAASTALVGLGACAFIWAKTKGAPSYETLRDAAKFSVPLVPQQLSGWLLGAADRWALKANGLDAAVGSYALASQFVTAATMPTVALAEADLSRVGEVYRKAGMAGVYRDLGNARRRFLLASLLPTVALVASIPLMPLVVGEAAIDVIPLVAALCVVISLDAQFYPHQNVILCASRSRAMILVTVLSAGVGMFALLLLVPIYGALGAIMARVSWSIVRLASCAAIVRADRQRDSGR